MTIRILIVLLPIFAAFDLSPHASGANNQDVPPAATPGRQLPHLKPEYTDEARAAGLQGIVSLYVETDSTGHPTVVQVMQGLGLGLDQKAIDAVKQANYQIADRRDVDVEFRLDHSAPWSVHTEAYSVPIPQGQRVDNVVKPVPLRYLAPDPAGCQFAGSVMLNFTIGADGEPHSIRPSGTYEGRQANAAVKAVEGWQFEPAALDGQTTEAHAEVEFDCSPPGMILQSELPPVRVYRVGGGVSVPTLARKVEPEYSEEARKAKAQGSTMLYVQISPEGRPTDIRVVRPLGLGLDEKAMEAVKRWRFKPGMKDGQPVTVEATIEVNFKLL